MHPWQSLLNEAETFLRQNLVTSFRITLNGTTKPGATEKEESAWWNMKMRETMTGFELLEHFKNATHVSQF